MQKATCSVSAKKLSTHAVEHQPADGESAQDFFRNDLGGVEHVEFEFVGELLIEQLQAAVPIRGSCPTWMRPRDRGGGSRDRRR